MGNGDVERDGRGRAATPVDDAVARVIKNDTERRFYEEYKSPLFKFVSRRVSDPTTAWVLVQETFTDYLMRDRSGVKKPKSLLFRIARKRIAKHYEPRTRDATAHVLDIGGDEASATPLEELAFVEPIAEQDDEIDRARAVLRLPNGIRHVVELYLTGMSGTEIAERCGASESAVYRCLDRARELLAISLGLKPPRKEDE